MRLDLGSGFAIDLPRADDGACPGIGAVTWQGIPLRDPRLPWTVACESEAGLCFALSHLLAVERDGPATVLVFAAAGRWMPRAQEADAMGDARVRTRRLASARATVRWSFRPIAEQVAGQEWAGLAMRIAISSPGHPLHWLIEDATWELGGRATGCTLIQQDVSTIGLEQPVAADSAFSTIEKFVTDGWGGAYPMDMLPRCAGSAPCDFQARDDLALCIYSERPGLSRARIEKFADEDVIHHTERPFFRLTEEAIAPERTLLVHRAPRALDRRSRRELWLDCFTHVRARIHAAHGFRLETPRPMVHAHLWDADLQARGPRWTEALAAALPLYRRLGYRDVFTHGVWESITSDPARSSADGNICAPYRFRFAEAFGGDAGMAALGAVAQAAGVGMFQWYSFHLSKFAPVWREHPDWMLREANGDPYDANYGILCAGRLNSDYGRWFEDDIRHSCAAAGSAGIFWDSYQNLGLTAVDWGSPDKAPQAELIWAMQARQQAAGLRHRPEITTIFGVSQVAMFGFAADRFRRRLWDDVVQGDQAFALLDTSPGFFSERYPFGAGGCDAERYFWLVAHRCIPGISARPWSSPADPSHGGPQLPGADQADAFARVNRLYNRCEPHLHRLRLADDGGHVL
ncbi:MAG: hypothetical protein J0M02_12145, partial [Planctomycetes bacterium]|nr:hypothetical protein [Planctomycetota bacterium]